MALQELRDRSQLERLLAALEGRYHGHVPDGELNDRSVAVLVCARPGVAFTQVVTSTGRAAAIARIPIGSWGLAFASVHLDAFDPGMRRTQAEELVDWTQPIDERNVILAGDFNFDADFLARHEPGHSERIGDSTSKMG